MADELNEEIKDEEIKEETAEANADGENGEGNSEAPKNNGRVFFYIALACTILGGIFFALTFTPLAVYSLLASILFCLASLSLLGAQKKKENFKGVTALTVVTYILFGLFIAVFIGGVIWSIVA